mmetsp:Transcript_11006/g.16692  ORF Transcript_11006/g.16692 Transcript_11006/m.16692 type:complete len:322 (-) Transcript_11006:104-1069(-)
MTVVGRGAYGKVFLVKKRGEDDTPYALKILKKTQLVKDSLLEKTQAERSILEKIKNPYIVSLYYAFQTETKLYFVIDYLNGGELFTYLRKEKVFSEKRARIYLAEIIIAIGHLHKNNILYRDLKPENVLFDSEGHIKITDFGLSKTGFADGENTNSFVGTPEYMAPEIIKGTGHSRGADWWSLGALFYEMLTSRPPLYNSNRKQMLEDIISKKPIEMRSHFSPEATNLLRRLLERDPAKRLGSNEDDAAALMRHPFFKGIDWEKVKNKEHKAPFKPKVKGAFDTARIDKFFTKEEPKETLIDPNALGEKDKKAAYFDGFTY